MKSNGFRGVVIVLMLGLIGYLGYMLVKEPSREIGVIKDAPSFTLQNLDGSEVTLENSSGKARLFYFFYSTCPDVCSPTTYTLSKLQGMLQEKGEFGKKTAIMSITFDPTNDTPEQLKTFSQRYQADYSGWYFLRGDEKYVTKLAEDFGIMVSKDPKTGTYTHSNLFLLVDAEGKLRTYYTGNDEDLNLEQVANDLIQISKD